MHRKFIQWILLLFCVVFVSSLFLLLVKSTLLSVIFLLFSTMFIYYNIYLYLMVTGLYGTLFVLSLNIEIHHSFISLLAVCIISFFIIGLTFTWYEDYFVTTVE